MKETIQQNPSRQTPAIEQTARSFLPPRSFRNELQDLPPEALDQLRGKVIALSTRTGKILGVADDVETLQADIAALAISESWRLYDGPMDTPPARLNDDE